MKTLNTLTGCLGLAFLAAMVFLTLNPPLMAQGTFAPTAQSSAAPAAQSAQPTAAAAGNAPSVFSSDPLSGMANKNYTGERITLDFQNADIHNILRLIGEVSGKNVVVSDQVSGKVTLKLKNVPWDQALDIVLASKNLGVMENGNVLRIDSMDAIRRATPDLSDPATRVPMLKKIFTPKYSSVSAMAAELDKAKSIRGRVRVIGNDIYVDDDEFSIQQLMQVFMRNDRVTKQILIEARIVEASTSFSQSLGIRWGGSGGHNLRQPTATDSTTWMDDHSNSMPNIGGQSGTETWHRGEHFGAVDVGAAGQAMRLGYGFLNKSGTMLLNAELTVNENIGETKLISAPRIMASNDQEVYIKQGTQIPYQSSSGNLGTNVEFKDAVMELRVTPHIEENGQIVSLDITLTKDSPTFIEGNGEPAIDKKEAKTKLMVKDGETVVIGGIIEENQGNNSTRVPGLHAIPLLGWLFQNRNTTAEKRELLVFITANIIPISI
ncbi:MAG: type IV pilus secretin PilQ [Deltaproteobacteria bacterium]|jgi:type IV pilus assembly protein PilQ|nr:type IV pilus secretin PilQ [Deltaproteobacteria bacterium]